MNKAIGSLKGWEDSDFYHEMRVGREAMGDTRTSLEDREAVVAVAALMVICAPSNMMISASSHSTEMGMRLSLWQQAANGEPFNLDLSKFL